MIHAEFRCRVACLAPAALMPAIAMAEQDEDEQQMGAAIRLIVHEPQPNAFATPAATRTSPIHSFVS
jgi:hypothetical protein